MADAVRAMMRRLRIRGSAERRIILVASYPSTPGIWPCRSVSESARRTEDQDEGEKLPTHVHDDDRVLLALDLLDRLLAVVDGVDDELRTRGRRQRRAG